MSFEDNTKDLLISRFVDVITPLRWLCLLESVGTFI